MISGLWIERSIRLHAGHGAYLGFSISLSPCPSLSTIGSMRTMADHSITTTPHLHARSCSLLSKYIHTYIGMFKLKKNRELTVLFNSSLMFEIVCVCWLGWFVGLFLQNLFCLSITSLSQVSFQEPRVSSQSLGDPLFLSKTEGVGPILQTSQPQPRKSSRATRSGNRACLINSYLLTSCLSLHIYLLMNL